LPAVVELAYRKVNLLDLRIAFGNALVVRNFECTCGGLARSFPTSLLSASRAIAIRARPKSSMWMADRLMNRDAQIVGVATFP